MSPSVGGPTHEPGERTGPVVVTVDEDGNPTGVVDRTVAHGLPGVRHLAFSVVIFDGRGRMLLQRRADHKPTFGGYWANACCSHPQPGETVIQAAERRVGEELGVRLVGATEAGRFTYTAADPETGMGENEFDVVVVGSIDAEPDPDDTEIAELRWLSREELDESDLRRAPWLGGVLEIVGW